MFADISGLDCPTNVKFEDEYTCENAERLRQKAIIDNDKRILVFYKVSVEVFVVGLNVNHIKS